MSRVLAHFSPLDILSLIQSSEEHIPVMIKYNWPDGERVICPRDGNFLCVFFCYMRQDTVHEAVFNQPLRGVCPKWR